MILQGKGGVGKSFIAASLAQFLNQKNGVSTLCIDTDPVNATLHGYKALDVTKIEILENDEINPRLFDKLIEIIAETDRDIVIDNGSNSFVPLSSYILSNQIYELINELGHKLTIHTVITGGQALTDTISGFSQLVKQFPDQAEFVVWLNPYWGPIEYDGKTFEQMKIYKDYKDRISAIIALPDFKKETHGHDLGNILKRRITFNEVNDTQDLSIMSKHRLMIIKTDIFKLIENAKVI